MKKPICEVCRRRCDYLSSLTSLGGTVYVRAVCARERFSEAHELIVKAGTDDGPFSWEGKHYNLRYVTPSAGVVSVQL
jgi:hypothetical protein